MNRSKETNNDVKKNSFVAIASFIDILGFGSKIKAANNYHDIEEIKKMTDKIRNCFDTYNTSEFKRDALNITKGREIMFSDSLIFFNPIQQILHGTDIDLFDDIMIELQLLALGQMDCIIQNVPIRGGCSLGWVYYSDNDFISDALVRAVELEKDVSIPMIAIDLNLYGKLQNAEGRNFYAEHDNLFFDHFFIDYVDKNNNTFKCLNYLKICIDNVNERGTASAVLTARGLLEHHKTFIQKGLLNSEKRVLEKYIWLSDYHNSCVQESGEGDDLLLPS